MSLTPLNLWIEQKHGVSPNHTQALRSYQLAKIRETIAMAKERSRFYARLYEGLRLPETFEDFVRYPLISQADVIESGAQMLCVPQGEIARIVTLRTSGTTGESKRLFFTRGDIDLTLDFFVNGMKTLCGRDDRVLVLFPAKTPDSVGALLCRALEERLGAPTFPAEAGAAGRVVREEKISVACGPPAALAGAAMDSPRARVHAVLSSSDALLDGHRETLEENWSCEIFDHYGLTESGLGGAVECAGHAGMHIRENDLYFETLSPQGLPLPDGEHGELVMTTLTRVGMPLIRYRTGDYGRILSGICPCGSALRRIAAPRRP